MDIACSKPRAENEQLQADLLDLMTKQIEEQNGEIKRLKIELSQYKEDSAELLKMHGVDPDDKVDREDLKRMLNFLIGVNVRLKEKNENHKNARIAANNLWLKTITEARVHFDALRIAFSKLPGGIKM